jgi:hypothetical protein
MINQHAWLLSLTLTCSLGAAEPALDNGDMSAGERVPTGWEKTWSPPETTPPGTISRDTDTFASAPASLRFDNPAGGAMANVERVLPVVAGRTYTISAKVKLDNTAPQTVVALVAPSVNGSQPLFQNVVVARQGDAGWISGTTSYTVPDGMTNLSLIMYSYGVGTIWLDDVTVE